MTALPYRTAAGPRWLTAGGSLLRPMLSPGWPHQPKRHAEAVLNRILEAPRAGRRS